MRGKKNVGREWWERQRERKITAERRSRRSRREAEKVYTHHLRIKGVAVAAHIHHAPPALVHVFFIGRSLAYRWPHFPHPPRLVGSPIFLFHLHISDNFWADDTVHAVVSLNLDLRRRACAQEFSSPVGRSSTCKRSRLFRWVSSWCFAPSDKKGRQIVSPSIKRRAQ